MRWRRRGRWSSRGRRRRWPAPTAGRWRRRTRRAPRPTAGPGRAAPARTAASMRSDAAIRPRTGRRIRERWCSAPKESPAAAACAPLAQRVRSWTGSVRMPSGCAATTCVQVGEQGVVVVAALERGQEGERGQRRSGQRALPQAGGERERLLGAAAQGRPVAGDQVSEAQPLQGVDDHHDCAGLPGPGERQARRSAAGPCRRRAGGRRCPGCRARRGPRPHHRLPGRGPGRARLPPSRRRPARVIATSMCLRHTVRGGSSSATSTSMSPASRVAPPSAP